MSGLPSVDERALEEARARQAALAKPPASLGRLEELAEAIAGITGAGRPSLAPKNLLVAAADHGVALDGGSAHPQQVTAVMASAFLAGRAAVSVLARQHGLGVRVLDVGIAEAPSNHDELYSLRVRPGTASMAAGPVMGREEAERAFEVGREAAAELCPGPGAALALGEMGIGNTTTAAAIAAALTGEDPARFVGPGAGSDEARQGRKVELARKGLERNRPDPDDALDVASKVGGLELTALAGAAIEAARRRCPVFVDGHPATAAAMLAVRLEPGLERFLFAGHRSREPGHDRMLAWLGLTPLLDLGMGLGEGTGALLSMSLAESACRTLSEMATLEELGISVQGP